MTGVIVGCGSAGILAALPMPLGSRIEPLSPLTLAGPGGMPLTPASCAGDLAGEARRQRIAMPTNIDRPVIHRQEKIETDGVWLMAE